MTTGIVLLLDLNEIMNIDNCPLLHGSVAEFHTRRYQFMVCVQCSAISVSQDLIELCINRGFTYGTFNSANSGVMSKTSPGNIPYSVKPAMNNCHQSKVGSKKIYLDARLLGSQHYILTTMLICKLIYQPCPENL